MELIRGLHNLRARHRPCVATIGNFDGVHLGHQAVLGHLAEKAAALGLPTVVILFEPQPREFFQRDKAPPRIHRLRDKLQALRRYSVDRVLLVRFDAKFASLQAADFIERVLVDGLGVRYLVVGDDFRFGQNRQGDFAMLQQAGARHGFDVAGMHTFQIDSARVSSTRVREALQAGDLARVEQLLGRPYRISGAVLHGDKLGRQLGFPTANVALGKHIPPLTGVFAVDVFGLAREPWPGAANLGWRPTVDGRRFSLEVHLLDFSGDVYGQHLQVDFLKRLRGEEKFASLDELTAQIGRDVTATRAFFGLE